MRIGTSVPCTTANMKEEQAVLKLGFLKGWKAVRSSLQPCPVALLQPALPHLHAGAPRGHLLHRCPSTQQAPQSSPCCCRVQTPLGSKSPAQCVKAQRTQPPSHKFCATLMDSSLPRTVVRKSCRQAQQGPAPPLELFYVGPLAATSPEPCCCCSTWLCNPAGLKPD